MTDSELKMIEPLLPKIYDKKGALLDKVNEFKVNAVRDLNSFRNVYNMPSL